MGKNLYGTGCDVWCSKYPWVRIRITCECTRAQPYTNHPRRRASKAKAKLDGEKAYVTFAGQLRPRDDVDFPIYISSASDSDILSSRKVTRFSRRTDAPARDFGRQ